MTAATNSLVAKARKFGLPIGAAAAVLLGRCIPGGTHGARGGGSQRRCADG